MSALARRALARPQRIAAALVLAIGLLGVNVASAEAASVTPVFTAGNPTCVGLGYDGGFKVDPPDAGTYSIDGINTVTVKTDGVFFDWSSTLPMDAVIAKGGPNANVYVYSPEATSDTKLSSPINPNNNQPFGLSHIEFCFDYELSVSKTANTSFDRNWTWQIDKSVDPAGPLTLSAGQTATLRYTVKVSAKSADGNYAVAGTITAANNTPKDATITAVTDVVSPSIAATVDCKVTFPYTLLAGKTLSCAYSAALPDATTRTNTATVTTTGAVGGGTGTASVDFSKAKVNESDECVSVSDTHSEFGGPYTVCADSSPFEKTFTYSKNVSFTTCGTYTVDNTAAFKTNDTGTTGSDKVSVSIDVPCAKGCTLTPGYWKTHSEYGPAPYDDTWALLAKGADSTFFLSGTSYYKALWTSPGGNAYWVLAHAYIAAQLNLLNGADPSSAQKAFEDATKLLSTYTPAQIGKLKGGDSLRQQFIGLAGTLDSYNNGLIGPGHCDEV